MVKASGGQKVDTAFVLIIFCAFALSVLMVLMLGASVYKNMTETSRDAQDERTLLSFIWTKAKNGDNEGRIFVGEFNGLSALYFEEKFDDAKYHTMIYCYDGWVYELFTEAGLEFLPPDGERVMEIDALEFEELEYGLIKVSAGAKSLLLSPRSG